MCVQVCVCVECVTGASACVCVGEVFRGPLPSWRGQTELGLLAQYRSKFHMPLSRVGPATRGEELRGGSGSSSPFPQRPPQIPGAGRMGAADCPERLPAPAAAAPTPGRRRRRLLERVADPGGEAAGALETPPCENPARGQCVLSNYLFIEKKRERKKRSHMSGLYVCKEK